MDGLVVLLGAGVLVITGCCVVLYVIGLLLQRLARRHPDPELKKIGNFVRPGCEFDRQLYLAAQLGRAHQRLLQAQQRYRELQACVYPDPILREAVIRAGFRTVIAPVRIGPKFHAGQVRAARGGMQ